MKFSTVNFLVVFCLKLSASVATVTGDDLEVYNESIFDEIMPAATFQCAVDNQLEQDAATTPSVPSCYWYAQAHHGKAPDKKRRPLLENWEPLLEPVGGTHESCTGLPQEANVADKPLVQFSFLCVLDREWINYYDANQVHFATQGYFTLLDSVNLMWDRVSVLFEAQFGIRVNCARVVAVPLLTHVCATNNKNAEGAIGTEAHTNTQLTALGIPLRTTSEAGTIRFGTGSPVPIGNWGGYCHSSSPVSCLCSCQTSIVQMHRRPFNDHAPGFLNYQAVRTLAHELGHLMGICRSDQADCLNSHTANEVGDIMVWDGGPIQDYRSMGMFYKFATKCTPMYSDLLCSSVRVQMEQKPTCAVPLTCTNGGLAECGTKHVLARTESNANLGFFYTETVDRDEKHYVRCCSLSGSVKTTDLGGLDCVQRSEQGFLPDKGCSGLMNYPDAVSFCKQGHLHLCSSEELFDNWETDKSAVGGVDGTCGYHIDHWVWTRDTPITTDAPTTVARPTSSPTSSSTTNPTSSPTSSPTPGTIVTTSSPTSSPTLSPNSNPTSNPTSSPTSSPDRPITKAFDWRILTHKSRANSGWALDIAELNFYSETSCDENSKVIPNGIAIDSGNAGPNHRPQNAFASGSWGGRMDNEGEFWLGMTFDEMTTVKCMGIIQSSYLHFANEWTVQAKVTNAWQVVWVEKDIGFSNDPIQIRWVITSQPSSIPSTVPSILPSMIPSSNPSTVPSNKPPSCSVYNRRRCGKKEQCVWNNGKKVIGRCLVKKPKWEDDCTKYTKDRKCKKKFCKWDDGVCLHKCDTKDKMKCKEEVFVTRNTGKANVKLCKYKREPNLDFKTCLDKPTEG